MTPEQKAWIDQASLEDLLRLWRFAPTTEEPLLQGECGRYFSDVMFRKRSADPAAWVQASKTIGW